MRKVYWRPQRVSLRILVLVACLSVAGLVSVESLRVRVRQSYFAEKIRAARLMRRAMDVIRDEREKRRIPMDAEADPAGSGLIGVLLSSVTTSPGHLPAKQTSTNPNWAAIAVHYLYLVGVEAGDVVAVGMSGSFPATNIAVMAAIETLGAVPIYISSAGASQWGANIEGFMWPDMETALLRRKVFTSGSVAFSRGGVEDRALGLSRAGRNQIDAAIRRSGIPQIEVATYEESLEKRMRLIEDTAAERPIKAYINVGGGTTSVGTRLGKRMFRPGLNRNPPQGTDLVDSVMTRLALDGVPIIHLSGIDTIAQRFGFPLQPQVMPPVGEGKVFEREQYRVSLVVGILVAIVALMFAFVRLDWGYRVLAQARREASGTRPEPMV